MSYILDALKKVERERARARHPLVEVAGAPPPARRRLWPWAVAGALVLNAAVAGLVILRWPSGPVAAPERTAAIAPEPPATTTAPRPAASSPTAPAAPGRPEPAVAGPAAAPPEQVRTGPPPPRLETESVPRVGLPTPRADGATPPAKATTSTPEPKPSPEATRPSSSGHPPPVTATPAPATPTPAPQPAAPAPATPPAPVPSPLPAPPITTPGVGPAPAAPSPPRPPVAAARPPESARSRAVSDLPPAFQTAVAGLKLEVLLYGTTAADRMVFINGRKYVEGQRIDGEVVVERITADGAVLAHEGTRFLLTPSR